jgi:hypothetical protein
MVDLVVKRNGNTNNKLPKHPFDNKLGAFVPILS